MHFCCPCRVISKCSARTCAVSPIGSRCDEARSAADCRSREARGARAGPRLRRRRAACAPATRKTGQRIRARDRRSKDLDLHSARCERRRAGSRSRPRVVRERELRPRRDDGDAAGGARTEQTHRRDAADRRRVHRDIPQFRALALSALSCEPRSDARREASAAPLVRHAEHPSLHVRRLRGVVPREAASDHPALRRRLDLSRRRTDGSRAESVRGDRCVQTRATTMKTFAALMLLLCSSTVLAAQFAKFGDTEVHYVVVSTMFITEEIAARSGLERAHDRAFVNLSVLKAGTPVQAKVTGTVKDLLGHASTLEFREVTEAAAIYYLAPLEFRNEDTLRFEVDVTVTGEPTHRVEFQETLYQDPQ